MGNVLFLFLVIAAGLWFWQGDPPRDVARALYKEGPAPWETVDAFYYPSRENLSIFHQMRGLKDVSSCQDWVSNSAAAMNDPSLTRGDYECGVGTPKDFAGLNVYRLIVK